MNIHPSVVRCLGARVFGSYRASLLALALAVTCHPAHASTLTFDFGLIGGSTISPSTASPCVSNCVLTGTAGQEQYFTVTDTNKAGNPKVTVGAIGYSNLKAGAYV